MPRINEKTRLYRVDMGPSGSINRVAMYSHLDHLPATRFGESLTPKGWRHYYTPLGWKLFGKPAYLSVRNELVNPPRLGHARHGVRVGPYEALVWHGGEHCPVMTHTRGGRIVRRSSD